VLGGWSSGNKYALPGGLRASAQMFGYKLFMGLSVLGVVVLAGSFNLTAIVEAQQRLWFGVPQVLGLILFFYCRRVITPNTPA
jgi:NADH-quinone oxidoreductase subunit H